MKHIYLTRSLWRIVIVFALVAFAVMTIAAVTVSAAPASIGGTVTLPGSVLPVPDGTRVHLMKPDHSIMGDAQVVSATGAYSFDAVPAGVYILRAVPPQGSDFTLSNLQPVAVLHAPLVVDLELTIPSIVGTVFAPDEVTPVDAWVNVLAGAHVVESRLAVSGSLKLGGLQPGSYQLLAQRATSDPYWHSERITVTVVDGVTATQNLTLTAANIYGFVEDSDNNPVPNSIVHAVRNPHHVERDASDATGYYAIGGLDPGTYHLTVQPPWDEAGLISPHPITFTVPPTQTQIDLQFLAPKKIVSGTVKTNTDIAVENALVVARRVDKNGEAHVLTNALGQYQLELSEGLWALSVHNHPDSNPHRWIYPHAPQLVHFEHNKQNEFKLVHFKVLTADSTVIGEVQLPDGSSPPFTVTVALHHSDGAGVSTPIDATGAYTLHVPHGQYKVNVRPDDPNYAAPPIAPIHAPPSSTLDMGIITLIPRDSTITGSLTVSGTATVVEGVPVIAWLDRGAGSATGESGADGMYAMSAYTGTWLVRPVPKPDQPYLYIDQPEEVEILGSNNVVSNVNFGLIETDATIHGTLVDDAGNIIADAGGWAVATQVGNPQVHNGAPARNGVFDVLVPGGESYKVNLHLTPGAPYLVSGGVQSVSVAISDTAYVTFTLEAIDSHIVGALWDPRAQEVPTGVNGGVFAWMQDLWTRTAINPANGTYNLGVSGGVWWLDYGVDPASGYVALKGARAIPVPNGATVPVPLPVTEKDGLIRGHVLAPDGSPLTNTAVIADGVGRDVERLHLVTNVADDGSFAIQVPHGVWKLRAVARHDARYINPASRRIIVPRDGVVNGVTLQFAEPDALITGALSLQNGASLSGTVTVWAWNQRDQFNKVEANLINGSGVYTMPVISNTLWHVGAAFETRNTFFITRTRVPVTSAHVMQDLVLAGPHVKPAPLAISFDSSEPQYLELADGTRIFIPAGAMPVSGQVVLHITPIATFPHQRHANVYRYGYAFEAFDENGNPIEQNFNQNVLIVFGYDEAELAAGGINENWLKPAYFSTTTDSWTIPDSYVVDKVNNVVAMQIDHFTDFALTSSEQYEVFLPLVTR